MGRGPAAREAQGADGTRHGGQAPRHVKGRVNEADACDRVGLKRISRGCCMQTTLRGIAPAHSKLHTLLVHTKKVESKNLESRLANILNRPSAGQISSPAFCVQLVNSIARAC